ncbi:MAG: V-type ATP synthase subunit E [Natrialbaceae archaeon]|nr:V-type ATP synthase subunit E [Natrialbaceae archaeon]
MSLNTVVEDIREEARARAEEIREAGEQEADEIIAEAEEDAEEIVMAEEQKADRQVAQLREQRLSSAKLEAKQQLLAARRDALADVREAVEEAIVDLDEVKREELTRALLDDASDEFEDSTRVQVFGRAADEALIESILEDHDGYTYAGEYDCLGGVVLESDTSRIRVNNTFDSILESVWEDELKAISDRLFEQ